MKRHGKAPGSPVDAQTAPWEGQGSGSVAINGKQPGGATGKGWRPGQSGNPSGRPGGYAEFREMCRSKSPQAVEALEGALTEGGPSAVAAARVLLEYGWGKPASAPEDLDAVREGGGNALAVLTRDELLKIARGEAL